MESIEVKDEKKIIETMIKIYCHGKHRVKAGICNECSELLEYTFFRLERCRYGDDKPACGFCKTKCYKPEMRSKINIVMKYSGIRMMIYHPVMTIKHFRRA